MKRMIASAAACLGAAAAALSPAAVAQSAAPAATPDDDVRMEEVTIVGRREDARNTPGGAHVIDADDLAQFSHVDVQRIMRRVPGVSVQVEDGYGLRPNIGIRGVATERSGRITLLEDGVLIAPAPYSAPSAYYFPTAGRMAGFEVLKGPAAIEQGPYTIGGALNMLSTPIPREAAAQLRAEIGQNATNRVHATYGSTADNGFGFLAEIHNWRSDGFQRIDRAADDTGLDLADYMLKLAYAPADSDHALELKLQDAAQSSNQSYLGLADAHFSADPRRRYGLSMLDRIDTDHEQIIARYEYAPEGFTLTAAAYHNGHARNWFKTEGLDFDGSADAQSFSRTSWASIVRAVNTGQGAGGWSAADLAGLLDGSIDSPEGGIQLRSNSREYFSRGVQGSIAWSMQAGGLRHDLKIGARYHRDEEDRLQRNSTYTQTAGELALADLGLLGNAGNRIQQARAIALFIQDRIEFGAWTLTPGLRFEDMDQRRTRYEIRSGRTGNPASRQPDNLRSTRSNRTRVLLPGIGAIYHAGDAVSFVAGVHKGFTAPSNAPDVDPEEALNFELGVRFGGERLSVEAMGFLSDYDNLLGECTSSSGVDCEAGDAFNGDAATVRGIEFAARADLAADGGIAIPVEIAYTYMRGTFDTDIADTDFFGDVGAGDPLPYIPDHQLHATLGAIAERWAVNASLGFVGETCARASCGVFERTDDALTIDLAGRIALSDTVNLFARIENLADDYDIVGRHPYGARPNRGRTATLGFELAW